MSLVVVLKGRDVHLYISLELATLIATAYLFLVAICHDLVCPYAAA